MKEYQKPLSLYEGQDWHKYNLAKTNEKRLFYELLNELANLIPEMPYTFGRPSASLRDLFFVSCLKIYSNYSLRKIHYDAKLAEQAGYIKKCNHFNRVSDFFNKEITYDLLQKLLTISALPLKELEDQYSMDSSGFGSYQYDRWMRTRFYGPKTEWRNYVKGHVCVGTKTNIVCSAEITYGNESDVNQVPKLLAPMKLFSPKEISGDKGYSSRKVFLLIDSMNATPFIAFKSNTNPNPKTSPEIWIRMYNMFKNKKNIFLERYHKRSNVETVFSMVKMRLGEFVKSKNFISQRNEVITKLICHNICCLVQEIYENKVEIDFKKEKEESKIIFE